MRVITATVLLLAAALCSASEDYDEQGPGGDQEYDDDNDLPLGRTTRAPSVGDPGAVAGGAEEQGQEATPPPVINCFVCDSLKKDSKGADKCGQHLPENCTCVDTMECRLDGSEADGVRPMCYKNYQYVYDAATKPYKTEYEMFTRGCAKTKRSAGCRTEKTPAGERTSCVCEGDKCNSAQPVVLATSSLLFCLFAILHF